jgi:hypothetical protein
MLAKIRAFFATPVGKIIRDGIEAGIAALAVLNFAIPSDLDTAKAQALTIGTIFFVAFVSAVRRDIVPWVLGSN